MNTNSEPAARLLLKDILDRTTEFFRDKKLESPRREAEILLCHGLRLERLDLYLKFDLPVKETELVKLRELVKRRAKGEPMAYILGRRDFYRSNFLVNASVLVPRPETELLVELVLRWQKEENQRAPFILDLGSGSGCVGLSLLKEVPDAHLISVDISPEAIDLAKLNARELGVSDRAFWCCGNAFDEGTVRQAMKNFFGKEEVDVLVSNPPYIGKEDTEIEANVKKFEPAVALFSDENGFRHLKHWSQIYAPLLSRKSILLMELGHTQGEEMKKHFLELGKFDTVVVEKDLSGLDRVIKGERRG